MLEFRCKMSLTGSRIWSFGPSSSAILKEKRNTDSVLSPLAKIKSTNDGDSFKEMPLAFFPFFWVISITVYNLSV